MNTTQQRALAYAQKPFAASSFISSLFIMYYLLIRHPEKLKRMYHRLILSIFCCVLPLTLAIFWGTWAMPSESAPWAVGASGTSLSCSIQGFLIITFALAFPFYYASLSIFSNVALRNNFNEQKYAWMEKWIHLCAYLLPLSASIVAAINDWINPGASYCRLLDEASVRGGCQASPDQFCLFHGSKIIGVSVVIAELLIGTSAIIYLLCMFEEIQGNVEASVGMRQLVEKARKRRHREVVIQAGLYLISFWFGYIPAIVEALARLGSVMPKVELIVLSDCAFAFQGTVIMAIYFVLQQRYRNEVRDTLATVCTGRTGSIHPADNDTVFQIRANAAMPRRASNASRRSSGFSFHIFDGTPAEDSPWLEHFCSESEESAGEAVVEDEEESALAKNNIRTSLLEDN